tara:strand:- start:13657 stop:14319 length:663 start_codon:yes stop_codon:yes gene_type:complete
MMIYDSGILDPTYDVSLGIDGAINKQEMIGDPDGPRPAFPCSPLSTFTGKKFTQRFHVSTSSVWKTQIMHLPFKYLEDVGLVESDTLCVTTARHPVDRMLSSISFHSSRAKGVPVVTDYNAIIDIILNDPSSFYLDYTHIFTAPQSSYIGNNNLIWNVEDVSKHCHKFLRDRGGKITSQFLKYSPGRPDRDVVTPDRVKEILDIYPEDYIMWEKAYAVLN